jgi:hypothetical protein
VQSGFGEGLIEFAADLPTIEGPTGRFMLSCFNRWQQWPSWRLA